VSIYSDVQITQFTSNYSIHAIHSDVQILNYAHAAQSTYKRGVLYIHVCHSNFGPLAVNVSANLPCWLGLYIGGSGGITFSGGVRGDLFSGEMDDRGGSAGGTGEAEEMAKLHALFRDIGEMKVQVQLLAANNRFRGGSNGSYRQGVTCWNCGNFGHRRFECPQGSSLNDQGRTTNGQWSGQRN
jgi:hypothetical protein